MKFKVNVDSLIKEGRTLYPNRKWDHGGCCLHLEVSEFIEALRGKGNPIEEMADVLFTLITVAIGNGVDLRKVMKKLKDNPGRRKELK